MAVLLNFGGPYGWRQRRPINITAVGPITIDSPIEATTGRVPDGTRTAGNGGAITFASVNDAVAINSRVQASSTILALLQRGAAARTGVTSRLRAEKPSGLPLIFPITASFFPCSMRLRLARCKVTILATGATAQT